MTPLEIQSYIDHENSHWWFRARRLFIKRALSNSVGAVMSVLDVGCATGVNLKTIFKDVKVRCGIESDIVLYEDAKLNSNGIELIHGDANNLKSCVSSNYDLIAILDVLYHSNIKDINSVLSQAYSILNEGGCVIIADGAFNCLSGKHSTSVCGERRFRLPEIVSFLKKNDFEIICAEYWGISIFFLIFIKRKIIDFLYTDKKSSELKQSFFLDAIMFKLLKFEFYLSTLFRMPFGSSLIVVGRKLSL